jgi:hypothetical protein
MKIGDTDITIETGELVPNIPGQGVRPIVHVDKDGYSHHIYQNERGQLVQTDASGSFVDHIHSVKLTDKEKRAVRSMFLRYNNATAEVLIGRGSLGKMWRRFPGDTMTVGLVACSAKKRDFSSPAKDMYLGDLFKKARRWAELFCDEWGILSAKHGLLLPDQVIEPYDQVLPTKNDDLRYWSSRVSFSCYMQWGEDTHYYLLCGVGYRSPFEDHNLRKHASTAVLKGLSIGEQLSWLKKATANAPIQQEAGRPKKKRLKLGAPPKAKK